MGCRYGASVVALFMIASALEQNQTYKLNAFSPPDPFSVHQDLNGQKELCPRLCHLKKGPNGYGFNLHSEKSRPGQFIRSVDPDSPASRAGLRPQDRLVEVTARGLGTSLPGKSLGVPSAHVTQGCSILPSLAGAVGSCPHLMGGERDSRSGETLGKPEAETNPRPVTFSIRSPPCSFIARSHKTDVGA